MCKATPQSVHKKKKNQKTKGGVLKYFLGQLLLEAVSVTIEQVLLSISNNCSTLECLKPYWIIINSPNTVTSTLGALSKTVCYIPKWKIKHGFSEMVCTCVFLRRSKKPWATWLSIISLIVVCFASYLLSEYLRRAVKVLIWKNERGAMDLPFHKTNQPERNLFCCSRKHFLVVCNRF